MASTRRQPELRVASALQQRVVAGVRRVMAAALWRRVALPSLRVVAGGTTAALFGTGAATTLMAAYASYNIHAKRPRNYADDFVS